MYKNAKKKKNGYISKSIFNFYINCFSPNGEYAYDAYESELNDIIENVKVTEWIDIFQEELRKRKVNYE